MEWLDQFWDFLGKLLNPRTIIQMGGIFLLAAVVYAETGLLVGFFLPGDSLLFTAGLLTAQDVIDYPLVVVVLTVALAAVLGDITGYTIGARLGPRVFRRRESLLFKPEYVTMTRQFYEKHGGRALILGRYLPIIRTFAPVFAGVVRMPLRRFVLFSILGALTWAGVLIPVGYFLGAVIPNLEDYLGYIVIGLVVVTTVPIIHTLRRETRKRRLRTDAEATAALDAETQALETYIRKRQPAPAPHQQR